MPSQPTSSSDASRPVRTEPHSIQAADSILRGLIWKLAKDHPHLGELFYREYESNKHRLNGPNAIYIPFSILPVVLDHCSSIFLLIDALDEYNPGPERDSLKLITKHAKPSSKAKWLISSRNNPEIMQELNEQHTSKEVLFLINQITRELAEKTLSTLEKLPPVLEGLYARMMDRVLQHVEDEEERDFSLQTLRSVCLRLRPLSLEELIAMVELLTELNVSHRSKLIKHRVSLNIRPDEVVSLIHESVRDYLVASAVQVGLMANPPGWRRPFTLMCMSLPAWIPRHQRSNQTEEMCRQTLGVLQRVLGQEHISTLRSMNTLALVLGQQGKHEQAEETHRQTLLLRQKVLGREHPDTLTSMSNLAQILGSRGQCAQAEEIHSQTLKIREKLLGEQHWNTLASMYGLATVLNEQGKYKQGKRVHRRMLNLTAKLLGWRHPFTLMCMSLPAWIPRHQRSNQTEEMCRQTLGVLQRVLGQEHISTLRSMNTLALVLGQQGKHEQAEETHRQTLLLRQKVLGREHPDTLTSMSNLAQILGSRGQCAQAEELHCQTVDIKMTVLGKEHPSTLSSMAMLSSARCYRSLLSNGAYAEGEKSIRALQMVSHRHGKKKAMQTPLDNESVEYTRSIHTVSFTCACGTTITDKYVELKPGGIAKLRSDLQNQQLHVPQSFWRRCCKNFCAVFGELSSSDPVKPGTTEPSASTSDTISRSTTSSHHASPTNNDQNPNNTLPANSTQCANSSAIINSSQENPPFLLLCFPSNISGVMLQHEEIPINLVKHDRDLFQFLNGVHLKRNNHASSWLRMKRVTRLSFAAFEVDLNNYVDLKPHLSTCCAPASHSCVLPPAHLLRPPSPEYSYKPETQDHCPPRGPGYMTHYFQHPEEVHEQQNYILHQVPKYLHGQLPTASDSPIRGWGLSFEEGLDYWFVIFLVMLSSLVFGIMWTIFKRDIQGGFSIAAYCVAAEALFLMYFLAPSSRT